MKKLCLTLFTIILSVQWVFAQWGTAGTNIYNTNTGNVYVGTITPSSMSTYKLEVYGTSPALGLSGATNGVGQLVSLDFNQQTTISGATRQGGSIRSVATGTYTGGNGSTYTADLVFYASKAGVNTEYMRILSGGSVAIGTSNPQGYLFAVNGSAIATSMTVKLNANWPDYVFNPAYRLPSLADLSAYINLNYRLPGMPSAEQVAKNGLNLGEMDKLFTQKIEELTLYLIQKDEQLNEMKETYNKQQAIIDQQQQQIETLQQYVKDQNKTSRTLQKEIDELETKLSLLAKSPK